MFKYLNIYKKEIDRLRKDEPNHPSINSLWRYFFKWKKLANSNSVEAQLPWISFPVIDFLNTTVNSQTKVFEYGGGGSTVYFLRTAAQVVTVEHNKEWFEILKDKIGSNNKWKPFFIEPENCSDYDVTLCANPDKYFSKDKDYVNMNFQEYASVIDTYENNYFDIVLVDGRARPSCIKHGIPKIKSGGYLILDNSEREYYMEYFKDTLNTDFKEVINYSGPTPFCTWFNRTSVWQRK